jgi:ABC-type antimicrobial peptide transport system permease subunit
VAQRSREMAIRSALGASPWSIVRLVVGQGLAVTLAGLVVGIATSLAAVRSISTFLYGVNAHDPATFIAVPLVLLAVAVLACFAPARRAANVDPLRALKG